MLKKNTIQIIAPARLHFGFLELNNNSGAFGGIGLSIDKFNTKIRVKKNIGAKFKGKALDKASFLSLQSTSSTFGRCIPLRCAESICCKYPFKFIFCRF